VGTPPFTYLISRRDKMLEDQVVSVPREHLLLLLKFANCMGCLSDDGKRWCNLCEAKRVIREILDDGQAQD
jgi:hypothetical protein